MYRMMGLFGLHISKKEIGAIARVTHLGMIRTKNCFLCQFIISFEKVQNIKKVDFFIPYYTFQICMELPKKEKWDDGKNSGT